MYVAQTHKSSLHKINLAESLFNTNIAHQWCSFTSVLQYRISTVAIMDIKHIINFISVDL